MNKPLKKIAAIIFISSAFYLAGLHDALHYHTIMWELLESIGNITGALIIMSI